MKTPTFTPLISAVSQASLRYACLTGLKAVEELISRQEDSLDMVLPIVTTMESNDEYDTIWIELVNGGKFSIHISRLKDRARVWKNGNKLDIIQDYKTEENRKEVLLSTVTRGFMVAIK